MKNIEHYKKKNTDNDNCMAILAVSFHIRFIQLVFHSAFTERGCSTTFN